jgi:carboxypeptidase C (cathepsin A)
VIAFFNSYPEFNKNNFYIAGESYAGIYIPYLATAIDTYNTFNPNETINFKGIAVGNGCTHPLECQFKY